MERTIDCMNECLPYCTCVKTGDPMPCDEAYKPPQLVTCDGLEPAVNNVIADNIRTIQNSMDTDLTINYLLGIVMHDELKVIIIQEW